MITLVESCKAGLFSREHWLRNMVAGVIVVILAGVTAEFGIAGLQLATLMAGFILVLMGCLRMGSVIKFIPVPVIVGFTAGIGVIIFVGQWRDFPGLPSAEGESFYQRLPSLLGLMPQANPNKRFSN